MRQMITVESSGYYAWEIPEGLKRALSEGILAHMRAYGLTGLYVSVEQQAEPEELTETAPIVGQMGQAK